MRLRFWSIAMQVKLLEDGDTPNLLVLYADNKSDSDFILQVVNLYTEYVKNGKQADQSKPMSDGSREVVEEEGTSSI